MRNSRLLITPYATDESQDDVFIDSTSAEIAARSTSDSLFRALLRSFVGNWLIWAPPIPFLANTLLNGAPFGWGDWLVFAWCGAAVLFLLFFIGPVFFYNQLLVAQLKAQPRRQRLWIALLATCGRFSAMRPEQLEGERCKALAEEGHLDQALEKWSAVRKRVSDDEYLQLLVSVYGVAGDWDAMMDVQRKLLKKSGDNETFAIDLAISIARYSDDVESAEPLISQLSADDLPEVALIGFNYVRGLIAAHRDQHQQALNHFDQAIQTARAFETLPIMVGLIAEINGYAALALKKLGKASEADALWSLVQPVISPHRSAERLIAAYGG